MQEEKKSNGPVFGIIVIIIILIIGGIYFLKKGFKTAEVTEVTEEVLDQDSVELESLEADLDALDAALNEI